MPSAAVACLMVTAGDSYFNLYLQHFFIKIGIVITFSTSCFIFFTFYSLEAFAPLFGIKFSSSSYLSFFLHLRWDTPWERRFMATIYKAESQSFKNAS